MTVTDQRYCWSTINRIMALMTGTLVSKLGLAIVIVGLGAAAGLQEVISLLVWDHKRRGEACPRGGVP